MPDVLPGKPKIMGVKKEFVYIGGAAVGVLGIAWYRAKKQSQQSSSSGMVTDPAGNVCSALDPNSGYCPGTPQDLSYQQTLVGTNSASYVGGQVIGYDQTGNPIYSSGPSAPGPGSYISNAQWSQAAVTYIVQLEPSADPAVIADALGAYINGKPVTAAQQTIIHQAIAFQGQPPVGGPNGNPPGIVTAPNPPPVQTAPKSAPGLSVTPHPGMINAGWSAVATATSYELTVIGAGGKGTGTSHYDQTVTGTHAADIALLPGNYKARVRAKNGAGFGPWSTYKPVTVKK